MRTTVANNLMTILPKTGSATEFMKFVQERLQIIDKSLASTLMSTLTTMNMIVQVSYMSML